MSKQVRIYYNGACSKCRTALQLLRERGLEPEVIEYLKHPPTAHELRDLLKKLGGSALELVRSKDDAFTASGLSATSSAEEVVAALVATPALLERPVVVVGERAVVARPPEQALSLLDD